MDKVSIVIPARNEEYLPHTVKNILKNAGGDVEIIVVLDGYEKMPELPEDERIKTIWRSKAGGMRDSINMGSKLAVGKYLMKCDAHCAFAKNFDLVLKKDCKPNWVVVPRRHAIDKRNWTRHPNKEIYYDFQYISHPKDPKYQFKGVDWPEYANRIDRKQKIVDLMTSQGSCWFMHKSFFEKIGRLDDENYGIMGAEAQEVCLKTWLSGGRYVLNRNTWYAHKKKRVSVKHRGYRKPVGQWRKSRAYLQECWLNNNWPGQVRDLKWLIEKFKPIPGWHTKWPTVNSNRYILERYKLNYGNGACPRVIKGLNRDGLVDLWKRLEYKVGAEIGVAKGRFASLMFKGIPELKMYLVDPYKDYKDIERHIGARAEARIAHKALIGNNAVWIKEKSETAFNKIKDGSLDFVYIDGNHRYDHIMLDIILWSRKVRPGGMVSGHDYNTVFLKSKQDIRIAVDDYVEYHKITPWYLTDIKAVKYRSDRHASWFWIKGSK